MDLSKLKDDIVKKGYDEGRTSKFIAYIANELAKAKSPVKDNSQAELYNMFVKYYNAGTNLDGQNVIVSGRAMGLITFHGYMNKVKQNHPGVFFDVQLVRGEDKFNFTKKAGVVEYTHDIANPFGDDEIKGAYCVVKFPDGNMSLELLNQRDYEEMKNASKSKYTWEKWPTEFWRKSVIKRACKVYFAEDVKQLEEIDNRDYGVVDVEDDAASEETKTEILKSHANKGKKK